MIAAQGMTWDMISYMEYGNEFYTKELMLANEKYHDVVIFDGGEEIEIPEIPEAEDETWN